ncbi:MAG: ComEC/Rec2 family competence protein [Marmoricola sp.]
MTGRIDLRAPLLAAIAWAAAFLGFSTTPGLGLIVLPLGFWVWRRRALGRSWVVLACWLVCGCAVFASAAIQRAGVQESAVGRLAGLHASVRVVAVLDTAPQQVKSRFGGRVYFDATVVEVTAGGRRFRLRAPVQVFAPKASVPRGARVRLAGPLRPSADPDLAAVLTARDPPVVVAKPGALTAASNRVRESIRHVVSGAGSEPAALVPALVDGDSTTMPARTTADFQTTGLTHLLAVSGTNLTLMVGGLLTLARLLGVRARGSVVVGALGVLGFVLLSGAQPSVLRAAAMGTIALVGLGTVGGRRGLTWLSVGAFLLLLVDPWLARSVGFALSVLATAGILVLAPGWRRALSTWLPGWAAEAVAVPVAAQLACTPLVAAISGQVSLVAVAANLLAGPFVGPTTVLGLAGGLVGLLSGPLGRLIAAPAAWGASAIIAVAHRCADLPVPSVGWAATPLALAVLTGSCLGLAAGLGHVLARPSGSLVLAGLMTAAVLVPLPTPGWPPPGWVLVACSVGQGDGLVLAAGAHAAVVVDAGPDPGLMDHCLRRLGVRAVPVVVLTHFHADHVDGLGGVLRHRSVGEIVTTSLADPASGFRLVQRLAAAAGVPVRTAQVGEQTEVGALSWQVLAPTRTDYPDSESPPNDASVVLLVVAHGVRILMTGDQERPSQAELRRLYPDLHADVLKVAHHGSSKQDEGLVDSLGARLAVISVGLHNDYGHPATSTLELLRRAGMQVRRTDLDGDVAVVVDEHGALSTVSRHQP